MGPYGISLCRKVSAFRENIKLQLLRKYILYSHTNVTGWTIQLGITRRIAHAYYGQKMKVKRVVPHPMYNLDVPHDNDVALFQVNIYSRSNGVFNR